MLGKKILGGVALFAFCGLTWAACNTLGSNSGGLGLPVLGGNTPPPAGGAPVTQPPATSGTPTTPQSAGGVRAVTLDPAPDPAMPMTTIATVTNIDIRQNPAGMMADDNIFTTAESIFDPSGPIASADFTTVDGKQFIRLGNVRMGYGVGTVYLSIQQFLGDPSAFFEQVSFFFRVVPTNMSATLTQLEFPMQNPALDVGSAMFTGTLVDRTAGDLLILIGVNPEFYDPPMGAINVTDVAMLPAAPLMADAVLGNDRGIFFTQAGRTIVTPAMNFLGPIADLIYMRDNTFRSGRFLNLTGAASGPIFTAPHDNNPGQFACGFQVTGDGFDAGTVAVPQVYQFLPIRYLARGGMDHKPAGFYLRIDSSAFVGGVHDPVLDPCSAVPTLVPGLSPEGVHELAVAVFFVKS